MGGEARHEVDVVIGGEGPVALTSDAINQIIRDGYAAGGPQLIARLAAATGLKPDAVKQRAKTMKLSSRERQREAVALSNRTRAAKGAPAAQEAPQNG